HSHAAPNKKLVHHIIKRAHQHRYDARNGKLPQKAAYRLRTKRITLCRFHDLLPFPLSYHQKPIPHFHSYALSAAADTPAAPAESPGEFYPTRPRAPPG